MPYKNIVFVKLEKRLSADHRWYMMSETAQLNYIRLILLAAETYNRIPKNIEALRLAFKTRQTTEEIQNSIEEIKKNFPKFRETANYYHFKDFGEKTNWVSPKERRGNSLGFPGEATDKEEEKDVEKSRVDGEEESTVVRTEWFESVWKEYPDRSGKKQALRHYLASVHTEQDAANVVTALRNYTQSDRVKKGYVKNGSTWFNQWQDWLNPTPQMMGGAKPTTQGFHVVPGSFPGLEQHRS